MGGIVYNNVAVRFSVYYGKYKLTLSKIGK